MTQIGEKYEIIRELGEGATGTVYLVRHVDLGVEYAVKVLNKHLSEDEKFISRFKQEGEVLSRFTHSGSVQLRDFGRTPEGRYYMTMDYADGELLKTILERDGALSVVDSLEIMRQALDVLDAAHKEGIIHRDIKPDNIMLVADASGVPQVKIMDFGIAKVRQSVQLDSTLTVEGAYIGTPQYMSPEQAGGERDLDHRVDIYSAGILLFEMLTGELPFEAETVLQTLLMQLTKPPKEFPVSLNIPTDIKNLVMKALEKVPEERYQTAAEFSEECSNLLEKARQGFLKADESQDDKSTDLEVDAADATLPAEGTRILCLDDDEMILHILKHILEKEGYIVYTTSDPSVIHNYIFAHGVELMICDVQMPAMPGTTVCKLLKKAMKDLKIILFSNIGERELAKLSNECKADTWISKNTKPDEWLVTIKEILSAENSKNQSDQ